MTRKRLLGVLAVLGASCVTAGVTLIFPPLGLVCAGGFCLAAGLLTEDGEA